MRDSTIFYRSFYEALKELPAENQSEIYTAIFEYSLNFNEVELKGVSKTVFTLIKPQLDANINRYKTGIENGKKGAESGKKGGRPKVETPKEPLNNPQITDNKPSNANVNVNHNVNENDNGNVKEIVNYLNTSLNSEFRHTSRNTVSHINARIKEGYSVDDFKKVIDIKVKEWSGDSKMKAFLRPDTLFGTKFESYLNQQKGSTSGATRTEPKTWTAPHNPWND